MLMLSHTQSKINFWHLHILYSRIEARTMCLQWLEAA